MSIILVQRASTVSGMEAEPSALRSREREAAACIVYMCIPYVMSYMYVIEL